MEVEVDYYLMKLKKQLHNSWSLMVGRFSQLIHRKRSNND